MFNGIRVRVKGGRKKALWSVYKQKDSTVIGSGYAVAEVAMIQR